DIAQQGHRHLKWEGHVKLAGDKGEDRSRAVWNHGIFDAVEVRPIPLPVIGIARHLDVFVWLELDEFERARADRMLAHVTRRYMARIDRCIARGEQRNDRRLWPFQMKRRGEISVSGDRFDVLVPSLTRIGAQLLLRLAKQQIPGAIDVIGGKGVAVVPFDAAAQAET